MAGRPVEALEEEYAAVTAAVADLPDPAFTRPTRCAGWDVQTLLFHLSRDALRAVEHLNAPASGAPDVDAVSYWRAGEPPEDDPVHVHPARKLAPAPGSARLMVEEWEGLAARAVRAVRCATGPVATQGHVLTLDDFVRTLVVEATVHGVDLAPAVGRDSWAGPAGLAVVRETLLGLARLVGGDVPAELGWDDLTLLLKGCGREPLTDSERALLGPTAQQFPLLA